MRIADDVLTILSAAETNGNKLFLVGQLDRKMYTKVNEVLELAGGKWNRKEKAHIFDKDAAERVDEIILTGEIEKPKDEFNFFPTPKELVREIVVKAGVVKGMKVLEPSAGKGAIAYHCAELGAEVDCYELMEANFVALAGDPKLGMVRHMDFLSQVPEASYDRVVMNPPFMKQLDIKHVNHAHKFLRPGGKLVAIMSAGVKFRSNNLTEDFRKFVSSKHGIIEDLPEGSFKKSGTMVNTVIVTIPN